MAGGYIELLEPFEKITNETVITAKLVFVEHSTGSSDLPAVGDALPAVGSETAASNCIVRTIRVAYTHAQGGTLKRTYNVDYSTRAQGGGPIFSTDENLRRFEAGGEIIHQRRSGKVYLTGEGASRSAAPEDYPVDFRTQLMSGSFTKTKVFNSAASKDSWITSTLFTKGGHINETAFEGFRAGSVLFEGVSGGNQFDEFGDESWSLELIFAWKYNPYLTGGKDDWQYIFQPSPLDGKMGWYKAEWLDAAGNYHAMFPVADFTGL